MILGHHTISELNDLVNQTEWRVDAVNDAIKKIPGSKLTESDPKLADDWQAFLKRWIACKRPLRAKITAITIAYPGTGPGLIPDEDDYQAVLHAISTITPSYGPTDLSGLQQRIEKFGPISFPPQPQNVAWDLDLLAYNASDSTLKAAGNAATTVGDATGSFIEEHKGAVGLTIAAGIGGLILTHKLKLI